LDPGGKLAIGNEDRDRDGDFVDVWRMVEEDLAMVRVSPLFDHKRTKIRRGEGKLRGPIPGLEILGVASRRVVGKLAWRTIRRKAKVVSLVEEVVVAPFLGKDVVVVVELVVVAIMVAMTVAAVGAPATLAVMKGKEGNVEDEPD
jgi:hypothetical protein